MSMSRQQREAAVERLGEYSRAFSEAALAVGQLAFGVRTDQLTYGVTAIQPHSSAPLPERPRVTGRLEDLPGHLAEHQMTLANYGRNLWDGARQLADTHRLDDPGPQPQPGKKQPDWSMMGPVTASPITDIRRSILFDLASESVLLPAQQGVAELVGEWVADAETRESRRGRGPSVSERMALGTMCRDVPPIQQFARPSLNNTLNDVSRAYVGPDVLPWTEGRGEEIGAPFVAMVGLQRRVAAMDRRLHAAPPKSPLQAVVQGLRDASGRTGGTGRPGSARRR